jgi:LPS O-antigen subunit length determinant protein (WzzB/FepE family)
MPEKSFNLIEDSEISMKDIIDFLIEFWMSIVVSGILGFLVSIGYLIVTPNEYQATAQIQVAQMSVNNSNNNNNNLLGVNIEDPNLLIARFNLPSTYSDEVIKVCGFENMSSPAESLASSAKFSAFKGVSSIVELKINRDTKEIAINCAQSLFESVKTSQYQILKPYIEESKAQLIKYEARLAVVESLVSSAHNSDSSLSAVYVVNRDEIKFLTEEILRLNAFISTANIRQTKLVSPIYAADAPVFPKKKVSLIVGLITGLLLGLLFVIGKRAFKN